jgi:hypothetical protein
MFLVRDERFRAPFLVFTYKDPRMDGYKGSVEEDVIVENDRPITDCWENGEDLPEDVVGRDPANPKHYKIFRYTKDLEQANYALVPGMPFKITSWLDFMKVRLVPPDPEQVDEEDWYNYLDKVDDEARRLQKRSPWPETPKDSSRDAVAEWLAKQHFITDPTIREIWYLPQGAQADEIRFLELSERLIGNEERVEPFDFGVDALGAHYRLFVGDVSGDQIERIRRDPGVLPKGWSIDGHIVWRRRPR